MTRLSVCQDCGELVSPDAVACPHCGLPMRAERTGLGCGWFVFWTFALGVSIVVWALLAVSGR